MVNAREILFGFVLEQAQPLPVKRRIQIYRALAEYAGSEADTKLLSSAAADLERADRCMQEFAFTLNAPKS